MVGVPGLEPGTPSLSGTYSNQLSYTPILGIYFCRSRASASMSQSLDDQKIDSQLRISLPTSTAKLKANISLSKSWLQR